MKRLDKAKNHTDDKDLFIPDMNKKLIQFLKRWNWNYGEKEKKIAKKTENEIRNFCKERKLLRKMFFSENWEVLERDAGLKHHMVKVVNNIHLIILT